MPRTVSTHSYSGRNVAVVIENGSYLLKPSEADYIPDLSHEQDCVFTDRRSAERAAQAAAELLSDVHSGAVTGSAARERLARIVKDHGGLRI